MGGSASKGSKDDSSKASVANTQPQNSTPQPTNSKNTPSTTPEDAPKKTSEDNSEDTAPKDNSDNSDDPDNSTPKDNTGDTVSTETAPVTSTQQLLWIAGKPGSGKTFIGDYLATRDWYHIDGDMGNQTKDEDVKARWGKLYQAMEALQAGKPDISADLWQPYFEFLVQEYKKGIASGKNVVLSFALLGVFNGDMDFLRSEVPGIKFVLIDVSMENQIDRLCARSKVSLAAAGTSEEEVWGQDYMAEYREKYGEEYTPERYRQMTADGAKDQVFVKIDANDKSISTINNDNFEDFSAIKAMNELVGLSWEVVDTEAIAAVNTKRMENLNLEVYDNTKTNDAVADNTKTNEAVADNTKTNDAVADNTKTDNSTTDNESVATTENTKSENATNDSA